MKLGFLRHFATNMRICYHPTGWHVVFHSFLYLAGTRRCDGDSAAGNTNISLASVFQAHINDATKLRQRSDGRYAITRGILTIRAV